jgi:hypothetical protein
VREKETPKDARVFDGSVTKCVAGLGIVEDDALVQVELAWLATSEEVAVCRFVAFIHDEARSRPALIWPRRSTRAAGFSFEPIHPKHRPDG